MKDKKRARYGDMNSAMIKTPQMEISGQNLAYIDGPCTITEYEPFKISIRTGKLTVSFSGNDLSLRFLNGNNAEISGKFENISFYEEK